MLSFPHRWSHIFSCSAYYQQVYITLLHPPPYKWLKFANFVWNKTVPCGSNLTCKDMSCTYKTMVYCQCRWSKPHQKLRTFVRDFEIPLQPAPKLYQAYFQHVVVPQGREDLIPWRTVWQVSSSVERKQLILP